MAEHYSETPGFRKGSPARAVTTWQEFETGLQEREQEIAAMLPTHVSRARFNAIAVAAVKQNPALLGATARSLFSAITKAAQDGLLPDGREGVITVYGTKQKDNSYLNLAQWNPMTHGLRKRAKELDGIIIDAQVVYACDKFYRHQGDNPRIEHDPAPLGTPRGEMLGAYAIFKREDGTVLHREVMDATQIQAVRSQSKAPDSLMWKKFAEEGWRKSVIRRGIKSVPVSEKLEMLVRREDDLFDVDKIRALPGPGGETPPRPTPAAQPRRTAAPPQDGLVMDAEFDEETGEVSEVEQETQTESKPTVVETTNQPAKAEVQTAKPAEVAPAAEPVQEAPAPQPEPEVPVSQETEDFLKAQRMVDSMQALIEQGEVDDLENFKKQGRINIDNAPGLDDDERDLLRGRFTSIVLTAQKKAGAKKKGK